MQLSKKKVVSIFHARGRVSSYITDLSDSYASKQKHNLKIIRIPDPKGGVLTPPPPPIPALKGPIKFKFSILIFDPNIEDDNQFVIIHNHYTRTGPILTTSTRIPKPRESIDTVAVGNAILLVTLLIGPTL